MAGAAARVQAPPGMNLTTILHMDIPRLPPIPEATVVMPAEVMGAGPPPVEAARVAPPAVVEAAAEETKPFRNKKCSA